MKNDTDIKIIKATDRHIDRIMQIYDVAKYFMVRSGNSTQWTDGYPQRELLLKDIENGNCYVIEHCEDIFAVFVFILGDDPTYSVISGEWPNSKPYGTIHRIASDSSHKGALENAVRYCLGMIDEIRIDTHENNLVMQHLLDKLGFVRCGIIITTNGTERIAYQYSFHK